MDKKGRGWGGMGVSASWQWRGVEGQCAACGDAAGQAAWPIP
jgi:hypothetical protein